MGVTTLKLVGVVDKYRCGRKNFHVHCPAPSYINFWIRHCTFPQTKPKYSNVRSSKPKEFLLELLTSTAISHYLQMPPYAILQE